jgi:dTDP-4-amino-4,6-dideoxygalactose transaminase
VVSLHATKPLGVGEGGFVVCTDHAFIERLRQVTNFGFSSTRIAHRIGINAKLSEYHAAIGLAQLQKWRETRRTWLRVGAAYRDAFADHPRIHCLPGYGEHWTSSAAVFRFVGHSASTLTAELSRNNVESRRWWQRGVSHHPAFGEVACGSLENTELLAAETLALPCYLTLRDSVIKSVVKAVTLVIGPE